MSGARRESDSERWRHYEKPGLREYRAHLVHVEDIEVPFYNEATILAAAAVRICSFRLQR